MQNGIVDWQTGEMYQMGAVVVFNNFVFQSLANSNTGNHAARCRLEQQQLGTTCRLRDDGQPSRFRYNATAERGASPVCCTVVTHPDWDPARTYCIPGYFE